MCDGLPLSPINCGLENQRIVKVTYPDTGYTYSTDLCIEHVHPYIDYVLAMGKKRYMDINIKPI